MRLWSLHPQHLDRAGLIALWREGLLAQAVLAGATRGYTRHPQLLRFRGHATPLEAIAQYLHAVADEAEARGYVFDRAKLLHLPRTLAPIAVTRGQLRFEWEHLQSKVRARNAEWFARIEKLRTPHPHPCFVLCEGDVEHWEKGGLRIED
ncbi:MAG: pyrimidine dimer DNA glycosylase/endonuclease V [Acidobacteriota bacterium]|nr:pyrimidine dimer DNA glycosylase/endonuclease V [Acidobacteriota bacterium]